MGLKGKDHHMAKLAQRRRESIMQNLPATQTQLRKLLGLSVGSVHRAIAALEREGSIEKMDSSAPVSGGNPAAIYGLKSVAKS